MSRWGIEGPPPEAYSRVTNPERFLSLHEAALRLLERLEADFDVERMEGYDIDPELEQGKVARPTMKLAPSDPDAAPMIIVFSDFPGVHVRAGRWCVEHFPVCGCDACDGTAEAEIIRLIELVEDVTGGRFRELIELPFAKKYAWVRWELWKDQGRYGRGGARIERSRAHQMIKEIQGSSFTWKPWPVRRTR